MTLCLSCLSCDQPQGLFLELPLDHFSHQLELTRTEVKQTNTTTTTKKLPVFKHIIFVYRLVVLRYLSYDLSLFDILNRKLKFKRNKFVLLVFIFNFGISVTDSENSTLICS